MTNSIHENSVIKSDNKAVNSKIIFGTNMFQSFASNSDSSFSDGEFNVTMDDDQNTILKPIKTEVIEEHNDSYNLLENVPLSKRKANHCFDQDENHLKTFNGAESFEKEKKEVLGDISNKKSYKQKEKLLKAFTPTIQLRDRWHASVQGNYFGYTVRKF